MNVGQAMIMSERNGSDRDRKGYAHGDDADDADEFEYMYLSDAKYDSLVAVSMLSSLLSLLGSLIIIHLVLIKWNRRQGRHNRRRNVLSAQAGVESTTRSPTANGVVEVNDDHRDEAQAPRSGGGASSGNGSGGDGMLLDRLVFGLSVTDCISSSGMILQPFLVWKSTGLPLAVGNIQSCELVGFMMHFFIGSCLYNAEMSLYFLFRIRYGKREEDMARFLEPCGHAVPFIIPAAIGLFAVTSDSINPNPFTAGMCMYSEYPPFCSSSEGEVTATTTTTMTVDCERGTGQPPTTMPLVGMTTAVVSTTCTWLVCWTVRKKTMRHRMTRGEVANERDRQLLVRMRAVMMQAVWYTAAYMNSIVGASVALVVICYIRRNQNDATTADDLSEDGVLYSAVVMMRFFISIQGFLNCIVYIRPRLLKWKKAQQDKSWIWCFCRILEGKLPPPPPTGRFSSAATQRVTDDDCSENLEVPSSQHAMRWMGHARDLRSPPIHNQ